MNPLVILGLTSFFVSLAITPVFRRLFQRWGFVDRPDQARKLHPYAVPNMGGLPIALSYLASCALLWGLGRQIQGKNLDVSLALNIMIAAGIVLTIGLLDDRFQLQPMQKLIGQVLASAIVMASGIQISAIGGHPLPHWLSLIATVVWLVGCTNAFNLIDGVDGLAVGVGLFATTTTLVAALLQNNLTLAAATVPLAGALLGFLRYNFNPASIFLGDSGSFFVGFLLGCFGIIWSQKSATMLGMTAPLMALSIPILDAILSVVRRFLRRQPILRGDRGHIHHRLLDLGFSPRQAVILLYAVCGVGAGFSVLQTVPGNHYHGAVIVVFCGAVWVGVQNLGYAEFNQARSMILAGGFRRALNIQLELRSLREGLNAAARVEDQWVILKQAAKQFGFFGVSWRVGEREYVDELGDPANIAWTLRIPLHETDFVSFMRAPSSEQLVLNVSEFADAIRNALMQGKPGAAMAAAAGAETRQGSGVIPSADLRGVSS